jgi:hypothetical protein
MTAARSTLWGPAAERLPRGTTDRGRQDRVPVTRFSKMDSRKPAQAWPPRASLVCPTIPRRLEWSTAMVHSVPTRPPWLLAKALQANGF